MLLFRDGGTSRNCRTGREVSAQEEFLWPTNRMPSIQEMHQLAWYHSETCEDLAPADEAPDAIAGEAGTSEATAEKQVSAHERRPQRGATALLGAFSRATTAFKATWPSGMWSIDSMRPAVPSHHPSAQKSFGVGGTTQ